MKLDGGRGHEGCLSTGEFHFVTQSAAHHMRASRGLERRVKIEAGVDGRRRATWGWPGFILCVGGSHAEILETPDRPLPCPSLPTYLPTYPTYGKLKKKSLGYYTN